MYRAVTYGINDNPLISTDIQGYKCTLAVRLGSRHSLFLRQESLDQMDKKPSGIVEWRGDGGYTRQAPAYSIPKLKIGDLELKNFIAAQSDEDNYGILGKFLGKEFNLLLDFPNNRIIACDTFSKLKAKKLINKDWICIPFEMHCSGIMLNAKTDIGTCKLVINTTFPVSCLRLSIPALKGVMLSSSLILGGEQFGNIKFETIKLPENLQDIDGFIGMDFLKEHPIYFDYRNRLAYIKNNKKYFESIPFTFSKNGHIIIDASVEGNFYPLKLDLGSGPPFSLSEEILQNINKTQYGVGHWYDFRGKIYDADLYSIPEIKIHNLKFKNIIVEKDIEEFHINTTLGDVEQSSGMIGLPILHKYNILIDCIHSMIYASNDHVSLQKKGLLSQNLLPVPFTILEKIMLPVEMDGGTYRLMLDTGATRTAMRAPFPSSTKKFQMMGHDFGERQIREIDLNANFDCDGFLGMDFLWKYPMFIDYINQVVYIDLQPIKNL